MSRRASDGQALYVKDLSHLTDNSPFRFSNSRVHQSLNLALFGNHAARGNIRQRSSFVLVGGNRHVPTE